MSETQLKRITKLVDSNTIVGIKEVIPIEENSSSFIIELNNGRSLNEFLPKGIKFLFNKKDPPAYSPLRNTIDFNPELLTSPNYLAVLAHECGHSLVRNPKKTHLTYLQTGHEIVYDSGFKKLTLDERTKKIYFLMKHDLDNEIDASHSGKIVADLLNVDPIVYDDIISISLQNHFWFNMYSTQKLFELSCPDLTDDTLVEYYNPFTQDPIKITYGEFKTLSMKSKDESAKTMVEIRKRVNL